jgi:predicted RNA-binding Zn-ribbon protein involved in translation (DUF1610 family)
LSQQFFFWVIFKLHQISPFSAGWTECISGGETVSSNKINKKSVDPFNGEKPLAKCKKCRLFHTLYQIAMQNKLQKTSKQPGFEPRIFFSRGSHATEPHRQTREELLQQWAGSLSPHRKISYVICTYVWHEQLAFTYIHTKLKLGKYSLRFNLTNQSTGFVYRSVTILGEFSPNG